MSFLQRIEQERDRLLTGNGNTNGKLAVSHHPELEFREHVLTQTSSGVMMDEMVQFTDYAKVYKWYTWAKKAISVIANNFATLPVREVDPDGEEVPDSIVSRLLANVNDQTTPPDLWRRYIVHKMLAGEVFFEVVDSNGGDPVELWPRRPDQVGLRPDVSEERKLFPRVADYLWPDSDRSIAPENMWHDKFYNPTNEWRGLAPIAAVRAGIVIDMFAQAWSKTFLQKGARPDYALIAQQGITRTERESLEFRLAEKFGGPDNWHRPIVLEDGITDIKTFSWAPKDIEWMAQREMARDEVGGIFGVPDEIMGYGRDTYENFDTALRVLWLLTIKPLADERDASLTHFFGKVRPLLPPGHRVESDISDVGVLQEDITPKLDQAKKYWDMGVPYNLVDDRLGLGMGEIPGGDVGYLPANLLPVGSQGMTDNQANGIERYVLLPPNGHAPRQLLASPPIAKGIAYGSAEHKALAERVIRRMEPHQDDIQRELKRQFQRQQNEVMRRFREQTRSLGVEDTTKVATDTPSPESVFNLQAEIRAFAEALGPLFVNVTQDFGTATANSLGIAFDLEDPFVQASIQRGTQRFAERVNRTTWAGVQDALREGFSEGLSNPDIADLLSGVFDGRKSDAETLRIARTETTHFSNAANLDAGRQAQAQGVRLKKGWLASLDGRERDSHRAAHQRYQENPIGLEDDFQVGACSGPAPGHTGCAEEDINDRCSVTFTVID